MRILQRNGQPRRRSRAPAIALAMVVAWPVAAEAQGAAQFASHPLVGTWRFNVPDGSCAETYRFRADGTSLVTSGEEVAESVFEITASPSRAGFHKWVDTIVKGNGKKDCGGQITDIGRTTTNYIRFDPSGQRFIVCRDENLDRCFGPLRRIGGQAV